MGDYCARKSASERATYSRAQPTHPNEPRKNNNRTNRSHDIPQGINHQLPNRTPLFSHQNQPGVWDANASETPVSISQPRVSTEWPADPILISTPALVDRSGFHPDVLVKQSGGAGIAPRATRDLTTAEEVEAAYRRSITAHTTTARDSNREGDREERQCTPCRGDL